MRIRQAMFPEIPMDDGSNVPIPQMDPTSNTAVQRLSGPSQMVKNAVVDLINYQVCYCRFKILFAVKYFQKTPFHTLLFGFRMMQMLQQEPSLS